MGLLTIVPVEETFLRVFDKPQKVKLTKQVIDFNYAHLSPFKNGGHLFFQADDKIYVWYLNRPLAGTNKVQIPEGYLILRQFRQRPEVFVIIPRETSLNLIIIKQGKLVAQLTMQGAKADAHLLDQLKREFSLANPEIVTLEKTAVFSAKPADILAFAHFEFKSTDFFDKAVAVATPPLIVILLVTAGFTMYESRRLDGVLVEKRGRLAALKKENASVQGSLDKVREQSAYWREFIARELLYPDFYLCLAQIAELMRKQGGFINTVEFNDNRITLWIGLKATESVIIKELLATGLFQEVKLVSSNKDAGKGDVFLYNLSLTLNRQQKKVAS
jgi:hypothetical protein